MSCANDLRRKDADTWSKLPERVQQTLSYPLVIPIGARLVVDLFVPAKIDLTKLSEVIAKLDSFPTTLQILVQD